MTISREEAMAAIAELERTVEVATSWTPDLPANAHISAVMLTLARAGAAVMFASEEMVARVADGMYDLADIAVSYPDCKKLARAALAALSQKE